MIAFRKIMLMQMWCRRACQLTIAQSRGRRGTMCQFESKERGRRGTMWQFESKEVRESLCFHSKSECAGWRKLVV